MFAEKHYPEVMIPEELDAYLAKGWYRMGQTIFTTHFLCFGRSFYSAIWIRLPLQGYQFRKSLRKAFRRNQQRFRHRVGPASITPEKEQLYRRYKASFPGILAPSLKDSLLDGEDYNIYNTYEVAVYEGSKLVALSFFDLGKNSAASIELKGTPSCINSAAVAASAPLSPRNSKPKCPTPMVRESSNNSFN